MPERILIEAPLSRKRGASKRRQKAAVSCGLSVRMSPLPYPRGVAVVRFRVLIAAVIAVLAIGVGAAVAAPPPAGYTLPNGGFESGFCHWTVSSEGAGTWILNDGSDL